MEKQIEEGLKDLLVQSQAMNADFIGFGDVLRIDDKDSWKEIEDSWQSEIYATSTFAIETKVIVRNFGDLNIAN